MPHGCSRTARLQGSLAHLGLPQAAIVGKMDDAGRRWGRFTMGVAGILCGEPRIDGSAQQLLGWYSDFFGHTVELGSLVGRNDEQ